VTLLGSGNETREREQLMSCETTAIAQSHAVDIAAVRVEPTALSGAADPIEALTDYLGSTVPPLSRPGEPWWLSDSGEDASVPLRAHDQPAPGEDTDEYLAKRDRLRGKLRRSISVGSWELLCQVEALDELDRDREGARFVDELAAHFPAIAPTIREVARRTFGDGFSSAQPDQMEPSERASTAGGTTYSHMIDRLRAQLTADQWECYIDLSALDGADRCRVQEAYVSRLCEHLPGFAPAIRVVATHISEAPREEATMGSPNVCDGNASLSGASYGVIPSLNLISE
jgi:hypothetical protein